jgi:hypothetical protein
LRFAKLPRNPEVVSVELERTWDGTVLKIEHWLYLEETLVEKGALTAEECALFHDLNGLPAMRRDEELDPELVADALDFCQGEIARLRR